MRISLLCLIFFLRIFVYGQAAGYGIFENEQSLREYEDSLIFSYDTLRIKERIEEGINKYGKENIRQVIMEMLYDDIKKIVDAQGPNPMDVLYNKMILDLTEEANGINNHAVELYSKAFADSLMFELYNNCNVSKKESMYQAFAKNLIYAALCRYFQTNNVAYITIAYNDVLLFRNYEIRHQEALRKHLKDFPIGRKIYKQYCNSLDSLNYSKNQDEFVRFGWKIYVEKFDQYGYLTPPVVVPVFSDIVGQIPENASLIEYYDVDTSEGPCTCAFIVRANYKAPELVVLNVPDSLRSAISNATKSDQINTIYNDDKLYHTFIAPLIPYIRGETLYIVPTSFMSLINFSAITKGNERLTSRFRILRLLSGADIITSQNNGTISDAVLLGNIKYDMSIDEIAKESSRFIVHRSSERGKLAPLINSLVEIENIKDILSLSGIKSKCFTDKRASEYLFKSFDGSSPELIHLATHGYYLNAEDRFEHSHFNENDFHDNMMLFNGLLLSGSNLVWNNGVPTPGIEDGILTSEEICRLDLSRTKLVVMSACCTALGDYNEVEGVFGLQRAFRQAGVQNQISTLWPVSEEVACEFMKIFYQRLIETKDIYTAYIYALNKTQDYYHNPYYWAAFILIGG